MSNRLRELAEEIVEHYSTAIECDPLVSVIESALRKLVNETREEQTETIARLRKQIFGCDCFDPSQCWEPCGTLGHSAKHTKKVKEDK